MYKLLTAILSVCAFVFLLSGCSKQIEPKTQAYYDDFRKKCDDKYDKSCCLSSVNNAEKEKSLIFESNNGNMNIDARCSDGYQLDMNRCETSYVWCSKNN